MKPTISVVIPAYNAGPWIDETLGSVLAQTRSPDEIVVVDDGSTDDTAERARSHGKAVTVVQQINGGPPAAYNRGFDLASSDYVAMCPADDLWEAHKLEWQAEVLEANPSVDVLFGRARYFGLREGDHPHPARAGVLANAAFLREMYCADVIPAPTAVVRRRLHASLGRFDTTLPGEDYEFWLRALRAGATFYFDPRLLVHLRQHGGNASSQALQMWEMNHRLRRAYAHDVGDPRLSRRLLARDLRVIARCRFGLGEPRRARAAYVASLRQRPSLEAGIGSVLLSQSFVSRVLSAVNRHRPRRPSR